MSQIVYLLKTIVTNAFYFTLIGRDFVDKFHENASKKTANSVTGAAYFCCFCASFLALPYSFVRKLKMIGQCFNLMIGCILPGVMYIKFTGFQDIPCTLR